MNWLKLYIQSYCNEIISKEFRWTKALKWKKNLKATQESIISHNINAEQDCNTTSCIIVTKFYSNTTIIIIIIHMGFKFRDIM